MSARSGFALSSIGSFHERNSVSDTHLNDTQCWYVANFRGDPEVANLRLLGGGQPHPALTKEQV